MDFVLYGDCRQNLLTLAALGVRARTCVTSPPYFGLRSYLPDGHPDKHLELGLEESPDEYVARMVDVFRAVRDVLTDDGTLWLNIGDSYAGSGRGGHQGGKSTLQGAPDRQDLSRLARRHQRPGNAQREQTPAATGARSTGGGIKGKDLIGIPWMLAFALRADGWFLRQEIIWSKPNPMPESVRDRPTRAHEQIFLLSKSPRYFYDAEAILEPCSPNTHARLAQNVQAQLGSLRANGGTRADRPMKAVGRKYDPAAGNKNNPSFDAAMAIMPEKRNKRSVWNVTPRPYKGAHFATYPPDLIEPCVLAGSTPGDIVLDPFFGSGTTGQVAKRHGRHWIGCELNEANRPLIEERLANA